MSAADLDTLRAAMDADRSRLADALGLRRNGSRYYCPACQSDGRPHRDGDFSLEAGFRCHRCGLTGDGFDIVRTVKSCDFPGAVEFIRSVYSRPATRAGNAPVTSRKVKLYETIDEAANAAKWGVAKASGGEWTETRRDLYQDATGATVAAVLRFDRTDGTGKTYRPATREGDAWRLGDPRGKWPLFNLPEIVANDAPVYLCEGEKAATAGAETGLLCTATAHGAQSPGKTDFKPLAGRAVFILPDADEPGREYAETVAGLAHAAAAASVRIVELPGLPEKGDIVEFLEAGNDAATVEKLAADAPEWTAPQPPATATAATVEGPGFDAIRAALWAITQEKLSATEAHRKSAAAVVQWLHARGRFYFHTERRDFTSVMFFDAGRKLLLPVQSDAFLAWLADALAVNRSERVFAFVAAAVETEGLSDRSAGILPANYWASRDDAIYLSNGPGRMVKITAGGVAIVDNGTNGILFPYGATLEPWEHAQPRDPFETCALFRNMAAAAEHGPLLFKLWATALPTDGKTKPSACFTAPVGAGKTALVRGLFALLGMPETVNAVSKNGEGDFWAAVDAGGMVCFDNVDTRVEWLPDALAAAATAGTFTKRRLYTDADRVTLRARASIALTSANPAFASDAGLADRLLVVRMNRRTGETAESSLFDEIRANRDSGMSWVCHTLSEALADREPVPGGLNARHPDWASMAVRIGRAIGSEAEAVTALKAAESDKGLFNLENDTVGAALLELLQSGEPFEGAAGELLEKLTEIDSSFEGRLSTKGLGKRLSKLWPHLESTLKAEKWRDSVSKNWKYSFRAPAATVFTVFETLISEKSPRRVNNRTFAESASETPQTPSDAFYNLEPSDDAWLPTTEGEKAYSP